MQRLLSDSTRARLSERQRANRLAGGPASMESTGMLVRRPMHGAMMRSSGTVGNPNDNSLLAGWSIVKGDTPSQMQANGTQARLYGFERHPVVYRCISLIADIVAAVPFETYRKVTTKETQLRGGAGDVVLLPDSPAQKLLEAPFFSMPPNAMRKLMAVHWQLYGNWFQVIIREGEDVTGSGTAEHPFLPIVTNNQPTGGMPVRLRLVHPERLLYVYLDAITEEPILYDWRDRYGYRHRTPAVNMIHCRDSTATDWIFGYPRAASALLDIQTDNEASTYVRQVVHNDGSAGTVFMLEELVGNEEAATLQERWYQKKVQRGERGRTAFMAGVKDVKQIGFTLKDLEFPDLRRVAREDICAAFGVDPKMIGVASASGGRTSLSGREALEARYRLIQETIMPMMRAWESMYDTWLMPEYGDVFVRFSRKALSQLTQDETEVWTRITAAVSAGIITREEGRSALGEPDKPDDVDTLYVPTLVQIMPVADQFAAHEMGLANQQAGIDGQKAATDALRNPEQGTQGPNSGSTSGTGDKDPNKGAKGAGAGAGEGNKKEEPKEAGEKADQVGDGDEAQSKPKKNSTGDDVTNKSALRNNSTYSDNNSQQRKTVLTGSHRGVLWQAKDTRAQQIARPMHARCYSRFHAEAAEVQALFGPHRHYRTMRGAPIPDPYFNDVLSQVSSLYASKHGKFSAAWEADFAELISNGVNEIGQEFAKAVGSTWNLKNPSVQAAVEARAEKLAQYVTRTTADQITAVMHLAFSSGMHMADTADLVQSTVFGDDAVSNRAATIARTESIGALNMGEFAAAKDSGVVDQKEWLTQGDDLVRDSHAEIDGETVDLEDTFSNGLDHPGDQDGPPEEVINCRCSVLYHGDSLDGEPGGDQDD